MRLRIALDGRARDVAVEGEPPDLRVSLEGKTIPARITVRGEEADVQIEGRAIRLAFGGGLRIDSFPRVARVEWLPEEASVAGTAQVVDVRPPMPGRIVRVVAVAGEVVRAGAPLVVLEAMKMQNEVPAPVAGVVREVCVREGEVVTAADVLVRLGRGSAGKPS